MEVTSAAAAPPDAQAPHAKRARARAWLRVDAAGKIEELQVAPVCVSARATHLPAQMDKHNVAERCAIPIRDLRILDSEMVKS